MKIRKTSAIFLAILLAAMAALAGCGGGSAGKTPEPTPVDLPDGSNWTMRTEKMTQAEADQDAARRKRGENEGAGDERKKGERRVLLR